MAKTSSIEKNKRRRKLVAQCADKRNRLKAIADDMSKPTEERFAARLKLAEITGRPRGYYRKLKMCRNQLRELASMGMIPGMVKSSW
jgi:small subunit ribosomal protein S14